ncbi:MAG: DUF4476 domain-containing protein [Luteibaculum sp.]
MFSKNKQAFQLVINQDTVGRSNADYLIINANVEILAFKAQNFEGKKLQGLLYGRIGDTLITELDFSNSSYSNKIDKPQGKPFLYAYKPLRPLSDSASLLANAEVVEEPVLEKVNLKYEIDAASILQERAAKAESEKVIIQKPNNKSEENSVAEVPCTSSLENGELKSLKNLLKNTRALNMQLNLAQSSLKNKCLSCSQLLEIFKQIEEDDIKVNLFKRIYPQLKDPERKSLLYGEFLFENSLDEIKAYQPN